MKRIGWLLLILIIPGTNALGCQVCVKGQINLLFPFMLFSIIPLLIWRILYGIFQYKTGWGIKNMSLRTFLIIRLLSMGGAYLAAYEGGIFLYLFGSFLKSIYLIWKNKTEFLKLVYSREMIMVKSIISILVIGSAIFNYYNFIQLDDLERAKQYTFGGGPERGLLERVAKDPNFDINRLKPMLRQYGTRDESMAYQILRFRRSFKDLIYFKEEVLQNPDLDFALSYTFDSDETLSASSLFLTIWLESLGVEDDVKNKDQLSDWIEQHQNS